VDALKNEKKESLRIWKDILPPLQNVTNFLFSPVHISYKTNKFDVIGKASVGDGYVGAK
jgi:hypothetical protein